MFISLNCQQWHSFLSDLHCQRNCSFMSLENWVIGYFAARTANMVQAFAKEVAIWRLNLTNWPICQAVSGYRWHLGAWHPPRHDGGQVQCTIYNVAGIAGAIEQKDIFSWTLVSRMLQFKGLGIAIRNSWKVGGIGGQSNKMIDNDDHQTRWSTMMIKVIDNISDNKTNLQVEPGLLPAGAPALRSAGWNIALQSSTLARI